MTVAECLQSEVDQLQRRRSTIVFGCQRGLSVCLSVSFGDWNHIRDWTVTFPLPLDLFDWRPAAADDASERRFYVDAHRPTARCSR